MKTTKIHLLGISSVEENEEKFPPKGGWELESTWKISIQYDTGAQREILFSGDGAKSLSNGAFRAITNRVYEILRHRLNPDQYLVIPIEY